MGKDVAVYVINWKSAMVNDTYYQLLKNLERVVEVVAKKHRKMYLWCVCEGGCHLVSLHSSGYEGSCDAMILSSSPIMNPFFYEKESTTIEKWSPLALFAIAWHYYLKDGLVPSKIIKDGIELRNLEIAKDRRISYYLRILELKENYPKVYEIIESGVGKNFVEFGEIIKRALKNLDKEEIDVLYTWILDSQIKVWLDKINSFESTALIEHVIQFYLNKFYEGNGYLLHKPLPPHLIKIYEKEPKIKLDVSRLEKIDIVVAGGEKDDIVSISSSLALKDILDNVKTVVLKNSRHMTPYLSSKSGKYIEEILKKVF